MACLYCGKRVSLVRQMADPDFCSDEHRKRYHDMARAALSRLMELDGAEAAKPAERTPAVSRPDSDTQPRLPERSTQPRHAAPPATGAKRRGLPAPHKPPLVAEAVPPAERDLIPTALAILDSDVVLWGEADCEFTVPVVVLNLPALWARRAPISADFRPCRRRAAADVDACRAYPAVVFAPAERNTVPDALSLVRSRTLAGLAMGGFRRVDGIPRRRFARPRSFAPTRLIGRSVQLPALKPSAQPIGLTALPAKPRTPGLFATVSHPAIVEMAQPSPPVTLPGSPVAAAPKSRPVVNAAALECAGPRAFRTFVLSPRPAAAQTRVEGEAAAGSRAPDLILPRHVSRAGIRARMVVCTPSTYVSTPSGGVRPRPFACDSVIQLAASFGVRLPASVRAGFSLPPGRLFPAAMPAAAARISRPQVAPAESGFAHRAHAIPIPSWQPAQRAAAVRAASIDAFRAILRQPRPFARPAASRACDGKPAAPPALFMPVADRGGPWFTPAGLPSTPEPPRGRKPSSSAWLPGGFARPERPSPRAGDRRPVAAAEPLETSLLLPALRQLSQSSPGSKLGCRDMAKVAAPAPRKADTTAQVAEARFASPASQYPKVVPALFRHQLSGRGFALVAVAPSRRMAAPAAGEAGTNARETLLPRPAAPGNARPAGLMPAPIRRAAHLSATRVAAIFRSEPAAPPPLPVPRVSVPASAPACSIRRLVPVSGFEPSARPDRPLRSAAATVIGGECAFRIALALPGRALRMRAACRIAQAMEIRTERAAPAVACAPKESQSSLAAPELVTPRSRLIAVLSSGIRSVPLFRREFSASERPAIRRSAAAAPVFGIGGGVAHITTPIAKDWRAAAPLAAGPKAEDEARLRRRGQAVRAALATADAIGIVVLPERKPALPHPAYALFGFARLEVQDYDDRTHSKTRAAEALPPNPVLPRRSGPKPVLVRVPLISGVLNGYPLSHVGVRTLLQADRGMGIDIEPVAPAFNAVPETDEREEALAPAVPDAGRRGWSTAKRLFR